MPSMSELIRTDTGVLDETHARFPIFWVLRYLMGTPQTSGYYGNRRLREFTKEGNRIVATFLSTK